MTKGVLSCGNKTEMQRQIKVLDRRTMQRRCHAQALNYLGNSDECAMERSVPMIQLHFLLTATQNE